MSEGGSLGGLALELQGPHDVWWLVCQLDQDGEQPFGTQRIWNWLVVSEKAHQQL